MMTDVDLLAFIERTNRATSAREVFEDFSTVAAQFGYTRSIFGGTSSDQLFSDRFNIKVPAPIIMNNYPEDWTRHYLSSEYARIDPIIAMMPRASSPVIWRQLAERGKISRPQRKLMRESEDAGMHNGLSFPMRGFDGETFVVSLASDCNEDLQPAARLGLLRLLAHQFFLAFMDRCRPEREEMTVELTKRERECLLWSARGESSWEISRILAISEATVRFHLANAYAKLGASNRVTAIVRAIRWQLITP